MIGCYFVQIGRKYSVKCGCLQYLFINIYEHYDERRDFNVKTTPFIQNRLLF